MLDSTNSAGMNFTGWTSAAKNRTISPALVQRSAVPPTKLSSNARRDEKGPAFGKRIMSAAERVDPALHEEDYTGWKGNCG